MNAIGPSAGAEGRAVLEALPVGVALYDEDRRLVLANAVLTRLLGLPPGALRPLSSFAENVHLIARSGLLGPGSPDEEAAAVIASDTGHIRRFRRRHPDGRSFDSHHIPLPAGGLLICLTDTSVLRAQVDEAERAVGQVHAAVAGLRLGLAVFSRQARLDLHNRQFPNLLGLPPAAVEAGMTFAQLLHRLQTQGVFPTLDPASLAPPTPDTPDRPAPDRPAPIRLPRDDGIVVEVQAETLPEGGWTLAVTDVTALADAEAALDRKTQLLSHIVDHVPYGITVYGPDRRLRVVNAAYRTIMAGAEITLGETIDAIIDRRARAGEYGPGDPADRARAQRQHDGTKPQYRRRHRPDGTVIDVRTAPLPDGSHISVVADVTAILAAETELARRAETLDAMLAHIRHGIILWDRDACIIAANPVAATLVNAPPGLLTPGRPLAEIVRSALDRGNLGEGQPARARARWLLEQDRTLSHLDQRTTRDGRVLEVRSDPTPQGGFVTTYTDITPAREAEEALHLAKSAAEAANAAKSRFLAAMSHELRTPLATIITEAAAIPRGDATHPDATPGRPPGQTIGTAAQTLLGLIDTILDVARLEAGRFDLAQDEVELPQVVRAVLRRFDSAAAAAELALVVDLPAHIPRVRADERRLREALGHIVSNAIKFTGPLGSVTIGIRPDWTSGALLVQVTDTGTGIAPDEMARAFEPFGQIGHDSALRPTGAGLGLYISRTLMRAHGGDLTLRSAPGQGTAATLLIPAARVLHDEARDTN